MSARQQGKRASFAYNAKWWRHYFREAKFGVLDMSAPGYVRPVGVDLARPGGDKSATVYRAANGGLVLLIHPEPTPWS